MTLSISASSAAAINVSIYTPQQPVSNPINSVPYQGALNTPTSQPIISSLGSELAATPLNDKQLRQLDRFDRSADKVENRIYKAEAIVERLSSLIKRSSNDTVSNKERAALDKQFQKLVGKLESLVNTATVGGQNLFDGNFSMNAADKMGQSIFVGIEDKAKLEVPKILSEDDGYLGVATKGEAVSSARTLAKISDRLSAARAEYNDFNEALNIARRNTSFGDFATGPLRINISV